MNDEELAARARQLAEDGVRSAEAQALARELLRQLADRLDGPKAEGYAFCERCQDGTASVPCPRCGGPACAGCGRCPPCDGPVPDEEEPAAVIPACPRCKTEAPHIAWTGADEDYDGPRDVWQCAGCGHEWSTPREDPPPI